MNLERRDFRAMIFYDFKSSLTQQQSYDRLVNAFGDLAPSKATVYNWYNEFKRGRVSLSDESREGRPKTAITEENIAAVRRMIEEDRNCTYSIIQASLGIGVSQIQKILHEYLGVKKLCSRWIPHNLTEAQKDARVNWCKETLKKLNQGHSKLVYNIVTGDESWIYMFEPESKRQSSQWVFENEPNPTKVKRSRSVGRKMIAAFFPKLVTSERLFWRIIRQ